MESDYRHYSGGPLSEARRNQSQKRAAPQQASFCRQQGQSTLVAKSRWRAAGLPRSAGGLLGKWCRR